MPGINRRIVEPRGLSVGDRAILQAIRESTGEGGVITGSGGGGDVAFLDISETDFADATYYYYGGVRDNGDWQINRYLKTDLDTRTEADEAGNPSQTSLAAAWAVRTTLTYA